MNIEGKIQINLQRLGNQVIDMEVQSSRPLQAVKMFQGKPVQQVLELIPLLYSVCGTAQAYTAMSACQQAMGEVMNPCVNAAQQLLVGFETTREHLWRILLDWPKFVNNHDQSGNYAARLTDLIPISKQVLFFAGNAFSLDARLNPDNAQYHAYLTKRIDEIDEILTGQIFSISAQEWLNSFHNKEIDTWLHNSNTIASQLLAQILHMGWEQAGNNSIAFMPELDATKLEKQFRQSDITQFIEQPSWDERCYETNSLQRMHNHPILRELQAQYGNGLFIRLVARLVELAELPQLLREQLRQITTDTYIEPLATSTGKGYGLAQVEAARGRLIHWVKLSDNTVEDFRILAPTEWNFHPQGVAVEGLKNIPADSNDVYKAQAELWLNAIDPCVSYELNMS